MYDTLHITLCYVRPAVVVSRSLEKGLTLTMLSGLPKCEHTPPLIMLILVFLLDNPRHKRCDTVRLPNCPVSGWTIWFRNTMSIYQCCLHPYAFLNPPFKIILVLYFILYLLKGKGREYTLHRPSTLAHT